MTDKSQKLCVSAGEMYLTTCTEAKDDFGLDLT